MIILALSLVFYAFASLVLGVIVSLDRADSRWLAAGLISCMTALIASGVILSHG